MVVGGEVGFRKRIAIRCVAVGNDSVWYCCMHSLRSGRFRFQLAFGKRDEVSDQVKL